MNKKIKRTFEIETSPEIMIRIERFFALLHHNSNFGHSGLFAMPLDGDGNEKVSIKPKPKFAGEVNMVANIGGDVEIVCDNGYYTKRISSLTNSYLATSVPALIKNGEVIKTFYHDPSKDI